jgi:hypothetical protein
MSYCFEQGIPHSVFLSQWSPTDRAKVLAYNLEAAARCSMCGTADWEWQRDKRAYSPQVKVCLGCYYKDSARTDEQYDTPGSRVILVAHARR